MIKMTEKMRKMVNIAKKLNDDEYKSYKFILKDAGVGKTDLDLLDNHYAIKNIEIKQGDGDLDFEYSDDFNKIIKIINNESVIKKIGGLKILMHGPTGTGKTTFVNRVAKLNKTYKFLDLQLEEYVSPKMGQTQINFINLANELNEGGKKIVFIDELDSVISSRNKSNDVGEHSRIVATFIKFLDKLNPDVIIFAATNLVDIIDTAVIRRFPLKIKTSNLSADDFFERFQKETKYEMSTQLVNTSKELFAGGIFSLADLKYLEDFFDVESAIQSELDPFNIIIKSLGVENINKEKLKLLSRRKKDALEKMGVHE